MPGSTPLGKLREKEAKLKTVAKKKHELESKIKEILI